MSQQFAGNLKYYRLLARMTQSDLANSVGITRSAVNNYEAGKSEPSFEVLCRFSDVLGVDLYTLIAEQHVDTDPLIRTVRVTDREAFLLDVFRKADATYQSVALDILRAHQRED